jgi:hypothetical protein
MVEWMVEVGAGDDMKKMGVITLLRTEGTERGRDNKEGFSVQGTK